MIADMMKEIYGLSTPVKLRDGQWHMPLIQEDERETTPEADLRKIYRDNFLRVMSVVAGEGRPQPVRS